METKTKTANTRFRYDLRVKQYLKRKEFLRCTLRTIATIDGHKVTELTDFEIPRSLLEMIYSEMKIAKKKGQLAKKDHPVFLRAVEVLESPPIKVHRLMFCLMGMWLERKKK